MARKKIHVSAERVAESLPDATEVARPEVALDLPATDPSYPRYRVTPGERVFLGDWDPNQSEHYTEKGEVKKPLKEQRKRISGLQERLYAEGKQSLLIVLQATDTGGKDGTINHVMSGVNPQGCRVWSFKQPSTEEASHDFLWRIHQQTPGRGMITIFNRSHYEDVLVTRVKNLVAEDVWRARYGIINEFERALTEAGTRILKFYLHISKDEQKRRLEARLADPEKHWKFSSADLKERERWDDYQLAFGDALSHCSTEIAPWYVVPANKKWYRDLVIARTIADTLEAMNPQFPPAEAGLDKIVIPD